MRGQIPNEYDYVHEQSATVPFLDDVDDREKLSTLKSSSSNIIPFHKKEMESITLQEWLTKYHLPEDLQNLFVNMDLAMKYIHDQGYYIESFALDSIELLNNSVKQVRFNRLEEMPYNFATQKDIVRNNIFLSAVLQIGIYANCLQYFRTETMDFLKENFDQFSIFLPEEDVPYYRGIIERGASVYFSAYVGERKKRDLTNLEKEFGDETRADGHGKAMIKKSGNYTASDLVPQNVKENEIIYASLSKKEAAFARSLIYPILVLLLGLTILLLTYLFSI